MTKNNRPPTGITPSEGSAADLSYCPPRWYYGCNEGSDVATSRLCDYIVQEVVVFVYRESETGFVGGSLNLDLGTMDERRNVAVVREGVLMAQVGGLGRLNRGQATWWETGQYQRVMWALLT